MAHKKRFIARHLLLDGSRRSMEIDALLRVATFDAFLARRMGADADDADDGGKGVKDRDPRNIQFSMSFSSNETVALGDVWLSDVQVPMDVSDEQQNQAFQHAQFTDGHLREIVDDYAIISREATLIDESNSCGGLSSPGSFIIEGRHGPVIANKPYSSKRKNKKRFQLFVASKQNNRSSSRRLITKRNLDETSTPEITSKTASVRRSPTKFVETPTSLERSPTGVAEFLSTSLTTCDTGYDKVPAISGRTVQKKVYNFIRVEMPSNLKGIMLHTKSNHSGKKSKCLSWWDDNANKDKPFTLKTDASFDSDDGDDDDDDDDASYTYFAKSGWFSDRWQDCEVDFRLKLEDIFDRTVKSIVKVERVASLLTLAPCPCNGS